MTLYYFAADSLLYVWADGSPVFIIIKWYVGQFVTIYPLQKVSHSLVFVAVHVIWAAQLHLLRMWNQRTEKRGNSHESNLRFNHVSSPCCQINVVVDIKPTDFDILSNDFWIFTDWFHKENLNRNKHLVFFLSFFPCIFLKQQTEIKKKKRPYNRFLWQSWEWPLCVPGLC